MTLLLRLVLHVIGHLCIVIRHDTGVVIAAAVVVGKARVVDVTIHFSVV